MPSVPLRFVAPDVDNLAALKIWEAASASGPFALIDTVTDIGIFGERISEYTTENALNINDWFSISWVDDRGAETNLSAPMVGGATTLVGTIIQRVRERDRNVDMNVVQQEAEVVLQTWFGDSTDPYDPSLTATYRVINGMTYMTLSRVLMADLLAQTEVESATLGLVSFKSSSGKNKLANIQALMTLAERDLQIGGSLVLNMERLCHVYGGLDWRILRGMLFNDQEFAFIPWQMRRVELVK